MTTNTANPNPNQQPAPAPAPAPLVTCNSGIAAQIEAEHGDSIANILRRQIWRHGINGAAEQLHIDPNTVQHWLRKMRMRNQTVAVRPCEVVVIINAAGEVVDTLRR